MGESLWSRTHKIATLLELVEDYESAVRATLINKTGYSLNDVPYHLSLADCCAVIDCELNQRGSYLDRAINPDESMWGMPEALLRKLIHAVEMGTYVNAGGRKSGNKVPKPIPLPGEHTDDKESLATGELISVEAAEERLKGKYMDN